MRANLASVSAVKGLPALGRESFISTYVAIPARTGDMYRRAIEAGQL